MKIFVMVKEVPDTYSDRSLNLETGLLERNQSDAVLDEISERSIEAALTHADLHDDTEVVLLTVGPQKAESALRKGLALGAHRALHVCDPGLLGADIRLTAEAIAAVLTQEDFDLVIAGNVSTDGATGMLPAAVAELVNLPLISALDEIAITDTHVSGSRTLEHGTQKLSVALPAVISVTETLPEARFPNFKGILAAKKKPIHTYSLQDLGIDPSNPPFSQSIMLSVSERPARQIGIKIVDDGTAAEKLATFLIDNKLA